MPFLVSVLLIAALTGCAGPGSPPRRAAPESVRIWWSTSELGILRLADIDSELAKPFEGGITLTNSAKEKSLAADCATARDLQARGYAAQYPRDIALLGIWTAKCLTLTALRTAQPAQAAFMPLPPYSARLIEFLPAALAPALSGAQRVAIERATKGGEPIRMVESTVAFEAARDEEIHINGEGWQETLVVLAKADFDGDDKQDWLLRADLAVERGTYRNSRLFLISRISPESVMIVKRELKPLALN